MKKVEALFEHARGDVFTPEEAERLWQNVLAAPPSAATGLVDPPAESAPSIGRTGWSLSGPVVKIGAGLLACGLVAFVATRHPRSEGSSGAMPAAPVAVHPTTTAPGVVAVTDPPEASPPVLSFDDLPKAHRRDLQAPARPSKARTDAPVAAAPSEPVADPVSPAPAAVQAPVEAPVNAPAPPASEGALLLRARQMLASDPASTLTLTTEDAHRFPDGALAPEREVLAIEALGRLGRLSDARARFAAFRDRYPQSPHIARLASLVGH
jgi:hypothetical protein